MKIYADRNMLRQSLDFMLTDGRAIGLPMGELTFKQDPEPCVISEPTLSLPLNCGQEMFDALWQAGYRPSVTTDDDATIDALKAHIKFAERVAQVTLIATTRVVIEED